MRAIAPVVVAVWLAAALAAPPLAGVSRVTDDDSPAFSAALKVSLADLDRQTPPRSQAKTAREPKPVQLAQATELSIDCCPSMDTVEPCCPPPPTVETIDCCATAMSVDCCPSMETVEPCCQPPSVDTQCFTVYPCDTAQTCQCSLTVQCTPDNCPPLTEQVTTPCVPCTQASADCCTQQTGWCCTQHSVNCQCQTYEVTYPCTPGEPTCAYIGCAGPASAPGDGAQAQNGDRRVAVSLRQVMLSVLRLV